jgi:hypothetical protein
MAVPWSRWGAVPYITGPVPFAVPGFTQASRAIAKPETDETVAEHPFQTAQRWAKELREDPGLNRAEIARKAGLSRARVTQIINLLELPKPIQECLSSPPVPLTISAFSERSLRRLLGIASETEQTVAWYELLLELSTSWRQQ